MDLSLDVRLVSRPASPSPIRPSAHRLPKAGAGLETYDSPRRNRDALARPRVPSCARFSRPHPEGPESSERHLRTLAEGCGDLRQKCCNDPLDGPFRFRRLGRDSLHYGCPGHHYKRPRRPPGPVPSTDARARRGRLGVLMITFRGKISLCDSTYPTWGRAEGEAKAEKNYC